MRYKTLIILSLVIFISSHSVAQISFQTASYLGVLKTPDANVRLVLQFKKSSAELTVVGFRGYLLPLKDLMVIDDSVKFNLKESPAYFRGVRKNEQISGNWTEADKQVFPLTFFPVNPDTIKGLNPRTTKIYNYSAPPKFEDGIDTGNRSDGAMRSENLDLLVKKIMDMNFGYVHGVLIARNNKLVLEEYFFEYPREAHFGIQSVTKSFVSALTGIAIAKKEIPGVDIKLCNYLPEYKDLVCNQQNGNIKLQDVMSMSTGLAWDEVTYDYGDEKNTSTIASNSGDEIRYLLTRERSEKKEFAYNSMNHIMMNHVLKQSTQLSNADEIKARILDPLGITVYDLGESKNGILGDIFLRPRDMMKFGLTYLNKGKWNGKQVVPEKWVSESTSPKIQVNSRLSYGYFWWTTSFEWKGKYIPAYFAWGYGGQYIFVVPSLNLVTVLIGTNWSTDPEAEYLKMMQEYIVRACD